jgi:hypothetical protein
MRTKHNVAVTSDAVAGLEAESNIVSTSDAGDKSAESDRSIVPARSVSKECRFTKCAVALAGGVVYKSRETNGGIVDAGCI